MLDLFALLILLVLLAAAITVWVIHGMLPGRIERQRNHPHADAITGWGWFGVLTMGLLCPLAFIWAYTRTFEVRIDSETTGFGVTSE